MDTYLKDKIEFVCNGELTKCIPIRFVFVFVTISIRFVVASDGAVLIYVEIDSCNCGAVLVASTCGNF